MIRVRFYRSFDESYAALSPADRARVSRAVDRLMDYFCGGPRPQGLGLRKLRQPYWEIRASLDVRVLFALEGELASLILAGDHAQVRRFLGRS